MQTPVLCPHNLAIPAAALRNTQSQSHKPKGAKEGNNGQRRSPGVWRRDLGRVGSAKHADPCVHLTSLRI